MAKGYDIEEQSQWLDSIEVEQFNANSVMLASKLVREIRKRSGNVVSLSDKNAVQKIGREVIQLDDRDLNLLYRSLLEAVALKSDNTLDEKRTKSKPKSKSKLKPKSTKSKLLRSLSRFSGDRIGS